MECEKIFKTLNILYVEDEDAIRELMQEVLQEEFEGFETAKDGKEGLEIFQKSTIDLVVTDIEMPVMDGLTFAGKIKEISPKTPIILLTAYSEKERLFKAIDVGVNKYLVKPFTPDKLLEAICEVAKRELFTKRRFALGKGLVYDMEKNILSNKEGELIKLTKKEKKFLELLLHNKERIVPIEEIDAKIWGNEIFSESALRTLVKRVRKKTYKELIKNFSGVGYKIDL